MIFTKQLCLIVLVLASKVKSDLNDERAYVVGLLDEPVFDVVSFFAFHNDYRHTQTKITFKTLI